MTTVAAYAAPAAKAPLERTTIERRAVREHDVLIDIKFAGICHSDIHQAREGWGEAIFPMVPGHEIAGVVSEVGPGVTKFAVGDRVGVGCMVDSCRECENCKAGREQYCIRRQRARRTTASARTASPPTAATREKVVVDENFVVRIPDGLSLDVAAPLLCAGITTLLPAQALRNAGPGKKVAVVGLGGLGHMGVKIAHALGAEVTVLSQSLRKQDDGLQLGADHYYATSDPKTFEELSGTFDLIVSTVSAPLDFNAYLAPAEDRGHAGERRRPRGAGRPQPVLGDRRRQDPRRLHDRRHRGDPGDAGLLRRARPRRGDRADPRATEINEAYERVLDSDVRYRFVIDTATI